MPTYTQADIALCTLLLFFVLNDILRLTSLQFGRITLECCRCSERRESEGGMPSRSISKSSFSNHQWDAMARMAVPPIPIYSSVHLPLNAPHLHDMYSNFLPIYTPYLTPSLPSPSLSHSLPTTTSPPPTPPTWQDHAERRSNAVMLKIQLNYRKKIS